MSMRHVRRWIIVAALASLAFPAAAQTHSYPGEREWTGPQAEQTYATADAYWTARELPGDRPAMLIANSLCDTDGCMTGGRGSQFEHKIWLHATLLDRRPDIICAIVVHELGHERGLEHSNNPADVMHATRFNSVPECEAAFPLPDVASGVRCAPEWTRSTRRIDRLWQHGRRRAARRAFRRWARTHPVRADGARYAGVTCE